MKALLLTLLILVAPDPPKWPSRGQSLPRRWGGNSPQNWVKDEAIVSKPKERVHGSP